MTHVRILGPERHAWRLLGLIEAAGGCVRGAHTQPDQDSRTHVAALIDIDARLAAHVDDCRARLDHLQEGAQ